jgi:hypothetical protein
MHDGQPILPDLADEIYLASEYTDERKRRLRELGTENISWDDLVDRLQTDLTRAQPRIKTEEDTDSWHEAFADLFIQPFRSFTGSMVKIQQRIKTLAIIPLTNENQWTGMPRFGFGFGVGEQIYFAFTGTTPIPETLGFRLLNKRASCNPKRVAFYAALGVEKCQKEMVFARIKERHQGPFIPKTVEGELHYLYLQQCQLEDIRSWVYVPLVQGGTVPASSTQLYFPSSKRFALYKLDPSRTRHAFISKALFHETCTYTSSIDESWLLWLARVTGARHNPLLSVRNSSGVQVISPALKAVLEHNPAKFLDTLRVHWNEYGQSAHLVHKELGECSVPCVSGATNPLRITYLPTSEIMAEISRLRISGDSLPLLKVTDGTLDETGYRSWRFLEDFGVTSKPDLEFYRKASEEKSSQYIILDVDPVMEIYQCMARLSTIEDYDDLR